MKRFKNILCVVETGKSSGPAMDRAVTLAKNNQAQLTVVEVIPRITAGIGMPDGGPISADLQAAMENSHRQGLEAQIEALRTPIKINARVLQGVPFLEIIHEVVRDNHDLVIKIAETQDWLDRLFTSDDMHLLRKCPCPVWLIKPQATKSYRRILVAVDVDDANPPEELKAQQLLNRQVMQMASSMALADFAELHIVHAWEAMGESAMRSAFMRTPEEDIINYIEQVKQQHKDNLDTLVKEVLGNINQDALDYLKPQTHLVKGSARKEIPLLARRIEADLVVMGTVGRTGIPGFIMGNTAETILNQIDCSVLAIKPPGFETPVTLED